MKKCPNCQTKQKLFFKNLKNKTGEIWFCLGCNRELRRPKWYFPTLFLPVSIIPLRSDISLYLFENDVLMGYLFIILVIIVIQVCIYALSPIKLVKKT